MAKDKNRWQDALDQSNERQSELDPKYQSRLKEQKRKVNKTVEKARKKK